MNPWLRVGILAAVGTAAALALWSMRGERPSAPAARTPVAAPAASGGGPAVAPPAAIPGLDVMAQRLAARLETTGSDDAAEWELLGRAYLELRRHADAVKCFSRVRRLRGDVDAQFLADYADALAVSNGKRFDAAVRELVAAALKVDPANAKAIELDASAAYEARDFAHAVAQWERLLAKSDPSSDHGRVLAANIAEARAQGGMPPSTALPPVATRPAAPPGSEPSWMPQTMKGMKAAGR